MIKFKTLFKFILIGFVTAVPNLQAKVNTDHKKNKSKNESITQNNNTQKSNSHLNTSVPKTSLLNPEPSLSENDYIQLDKARKKFEQKKYTEAINLYNLIPKNSSLWPLSIEEKGWAYYHLKDYSKVLEQTQTLIAYPINQLGLYESYLLKLLSEVKTCQYESAFKTIELFKTHTKNRIYNIESINQVSAKTLVTQLINNPFDMSHNNKLPQLFMSSKQVNLTLFSKSLSEKEKINWLSKYLLQSKTQELESLKLVIQKIKILEVETEQRVVRDYNNHTQNGEISSFKKTTYDELTFRADDLPWVDELGQFEVAMNACKQKRRML